MCNFGQASMVYFYFDFRDINKQHWGDLVPSLLTQLSAQLSPCCNILSCLHSDHGNGTQQPSDDALKRCLKEMLTVRDRHLIYLILNTLDECPDTSEVPSPRNRILQLLDELTGLQNPNLRICVTNRPEFDIWGFLEPPSGNPKPPSLTEFIQPTQLDIILANLSNSTPIYYGLYKLS